MIFCGILDRKANSYVSFVSFRSRAEALRSFATAVQDADSMIHKFPGDFDLMVVCSVDDVTGVVSQISAPELLAHASDLVVSDN